MIFQEDCRLKLIASLSRLIEMLQENAPPIIMAGEMIIANNYADGLMASEMAELQAMRKLERIRELMGYCNECDSRISYQHTPLCEQCEAKNEAWLKENTPDTGED